MDSSSGLITMSTTTTESYYVHPVWTLVLPSGVAPGGYTTGYKLPICNPDTGNPLLFSSASTAATRADLYSSVMTEAGRSSMAVGPQFQSALAIPAGVEFINEGAQPIGLAASEWLGYQHSETQSGLSMLAIIVIAVVLGAVTGGLADAALSSSMAGSAALTSIGLGSVSVIGAAGIGAAVGGGAALISQTGCFGLCGGGSSGPQKEMNGLQALVGGTDTMGVSASITSYSLTKYLEELQTANLSSGVVDCGGDSTCQAGVNNPTGDTSGWTGITGNLSEQATGTNQFSTAGIGNTSMAQQAQAESVKSGETSGRSPSLATLKPYIASTGSTSMGSLPPAP